MLDKYRHGHLLETAGLMQLWIGEVLMTVQYCTDIQHCFKMTLWKTEKTACTH